MTVQQWAVWQWRYQQWLGDIALALAVAAIEIIVTYFAAHNQPDRRTLDPAGIVLPIWLPLSCAPLPCCKDGM